MAEFIVKARNLGFGILRPLASAKSESYSGVLVAGSASDPSLHCALNTQRDPVLTVNYANGGPSVRANGIGHAASLMNTTPWALLSRVNAERFRIARSETFADNSFLRWEFYKTASPISKTVNVAPVDVFSIVDSVPPINITTLETTAPGESSPWIAAALSVDFLDVPALAEFAGVSIAQVLEWIGTASGVSWRASSE